MQKQRQAKIVAIAGQSGERESIILEKICFVYDEKNEIDIYVREKDRLLKKRVKVAK